MFRHKKDTQHRVAFPQEAIELGDERSLLAKARDLFWGGDLGFRWEKRCISGMQKAPQAKTVLEVSSDIVCRYLKLDVGLS